MICSEDRILTTHTGSLPRKGIPVDAGALAARVRSSVQEVVDRQTCVRNRHRGTWVGQAAVEPEIVWAKLAAMAQGAEIASKKLWS